MTTTAGEVDPTPSEETRWRESWSAALEALELDVEAAEQLLERLHDAGVEGLEEDLPPVAEDRVTSTVLAPMPGDFADRARRLLQRQTSVGERLAEAMVQVRAHRRALGKMEQAEARPVYFDRSA